MGPALNIYHASKALSQLDGSLVGKLIFLSFCLNSRCSMFCTCFFMVSGKKTRNNFSYNPTTVQLTQALVVKATSEVIRLKIFYGRINLRTCGMEKLDAARTCFSKCGKGVGTLKVLPFTIASSVGGLRRRKLGEQLHFLVRFP